MSQSSRSKGHSHKRTPERLREAHDLRDAFLDSQPGHDLVTDCLTEIVERENPNDWLIVISIDEPKPDNPVTARVAVATREAFGRDLQSHAHRHSPILGEAVDFLAEGGMPNAVDCLTFVTTDTGANDAVVLCTRLDYCFDSLN